MATFFLLQDFSQMCLRYPLHILSPQKPAGDPGPHDLFCTVIESLQKQKRTFIFTFFFSLKFQTLEMKRLGKFENQEGKWGMCGRSTFACFLVNSDSNRTQNDQTKEVGKPFDATNVHWGMIMII